MGLIRMAKRGQREKPCDSQAIFIESEPQGGKGAWPPKGRLSAGPPGGPAGVIKGGRFSKATAARLQKQQPRAAARTSLGMSFLAEDDDKWAHDRWQGATAGRMPAAARRRAALAEESAWEPEPPASRQRALMQRGAQGPVPDNRMRGWSEGENGARVSAVIQKPASVTRVRRGTGVAKYRTINVRKAIEKRPANRNVLTGGPGAGSNAVRSRAASALEQRAVLMPRSDEQGLDDSAYSNSGLIGRLPGKGRQKGKGGRGGKGSGKAAKGRGKGKRGKGW